jgi:asparagine synthase (glutamine-hydrolysing)
MCGIAGIIGYKDEAALARMLKATKHRGPNHTGMYSDDKVSIGMNRLSIVDLSEQGNQPLFSADKRYAMVYNGEVYNFKPLRQQLIAAGYQFNSQTDSEVVLNAYLHFGKEVVQHIRGMFAFAIWDTQTHTLFAARDHMGIKPFLYSLTAEHMVFCSELKGMLASKYFANNSINQNALASYLTLGHVVAPDTMVDGINMLLPGHYLEWNNHHITLTPYWFPEQTTPLSASDISYTESVAHIRQLVTSSVNEELVADVPLGVFLSGGLDSTIVTAAAKLNGYDQLQTYTVGFEDSTHALDETSIAQQIASFYGTQHHTLRISDSEIATDFVQYIIGLDQPSRDGLNTFLVSKHVSQNVTVALSGLGGDELFAGYNGIFKFLKRQPHPLTETIGKIGELAGLQTVLPEKVNRKLYQWKVNQNDTLYYVFSLQQHLDLFGPSFLTNKTDTPNCYAQTASFIDKYYPLSHIHSNKIRGLYMSHHMSNMLLRDSDAVAMCHSLEVRFPIIDNRLVNFALQMPAEYLIENLNQATQRNYVTRGLKRMLRDAFIDVLPIDIFNQSKRGFQLPVHQWLQTGLKPLLENTIYNPCELFNRSELERLYQQGNFTVAEFKKVWGIFILDQWYKHVFVAYRQYS